MIASTYDLDATQSCPSMGRFLQLSCFDKFKWPDPPSRAAQCLDIILARPFHDGCTVGLAHAVDKLDSQLNGESSQAHDRSFSVDNKD